MCPELLDHNNIISKGGPISEWLWATTFSIPFGIATAIRKRKTNVKLETVCLLSVIPPGFVLWVHGTTGKLALGGILALIAIICFVMVSAIFLSSGLYRALKNPGQKSSLHFFRPKN